MNPFDSDIFTTARLTASINEAEYLPRRLGQLGLFQEEGITTTTVVVEKSGKQLGLVPAKERGAPGTPVLPDKRTGHTFSAVHLPTTAQIMADEAQNIRAFGSEDTLQALQDLVDARTLTMARKLDATHEYQRMGAIRGQILDADGATELLNLYTAFGITQTAVAFVLDTSTTNVQLKCLDVLEAIEVALGDIMFSGVRALCGSSFWRKLITHPLVTEAYKYQQSQRLRDDAREELDFGGIIFERYRGAVNGTPFVPTTEAFAVPMSADELFITRYAPANYMDAVNTIGLPFYSSSELMDHGKGIELEAQSNPIHLCTRPGAIIRLHENALP
ncbi:MAG: major capsid protein E [Halioglobus sp.]|nr:major capsid protein E [Halioglobus sp.]|tara:strand:- start:1941 stop:2936 length:996 start_codon:yes stop_codon:yes gene_type:complete